MANNKLKENKLKALFNDIFNQKIKDYKKMKFQKTDKWDSLKHIQLIISVEKEFSIKVKTSDIEKLTTYEKILNYLK
tara:strand:- start:408 stop:638 length:231 start_codon:yes stop_codon:yes gene_type:complete